MQALGLNTVVTFSIPCGRRARCVHPHFAQSSLPSFLLRRSSSRAPRRRTLTIVRRDERRQALPSRRPDRLFYRLWFEFRGEGTNRVLSPSTTRFARTVDQATSARLVFTTGRFRATFPLRRFKPIQLIRIYVALRKSVDLCAPRNFRARKSQYRSWARSKGRCLHFRTLDLVLSKTRPRDKNVPMLLFLRSTELRLLIGMREIGGSKIRENVKITFFLRFTIEEKFFDARAVQTEIQLIR